MPASIHPPLLDAFIAQLAASDQRVTSPRLHVAQAIARRAGHFTAEEICGALPAVGRATVYRNIKLLTEMGYLCRVLLEDGSLHYQVSHRGHHHHHHLVCTSCGVAHDLLGCDMEDLLRARAGDSGFAVSGHWLEVYGLCRDCQAVSLILTGTARVLQPEA